MRLQLVDVQRQHGSHVVLDGVGLQVDPRSRLGLVGPNGSGKSTLLRILAGLEDPDAGRVVREPATLTAGYLPQEHAMPAGESVLGLLARRTGVAAAEQELGEAAERLADGVDAEGRYAFALERFLALGGGDLEPRAATTLASLGLAVDLDRPAEALSGGEAARLALAGILLSRFDVLLLDEPTNDLDFDGLERLERFLATTASALVVVSHDRAFLDRTVTRSSRSRRAEEGCASGRGAGASTRRHGTQPVPAPIRASSRHRSGAESWRRSSPSGAHRLAPAARWPTAAARTR